MNKQEVPDWMIDATNKAPATALQTLADKLPRGYTVRIDIQPGSSRVMLLLPFDESRLVTTTLGVEADVLEALRLATEREVESGAAIDRAWTRFQSVMNKAVGK